MAKRKNNHDYVGFVDDILDVHAALIDVREKFLSAVDALQSMKDMNTYIAKACGGKTLPFDADVCSGISKLDMNDDSFTIKVSKILHSDSGLGRCLDLLEVAKRIQDEMPSFRSKRNKLASRLSLSKDRVSSEYRTAKAMLDRIDDTIRNRMGKLAFVFKKYLDQRKANMNRQCGLDEMMFYTVSESGLNIVVDDFRARGIDSAYETMKSLEKKYIKEYR